MIFYRFRDRYFNFRRTGVLANVSKNPVACYNFAIEQYNNEQNIVDNIKLETPRQVSPLAMTLFSIWYHFLYFLVVWVGLVYVIQL